MKKDRRGNVLTLAAVFLSIVCIMTGFLMIMETAKISKLNSRLLNLQSEYAGYINTGRYLSEGVNILTDNCMQFVISGDVDKMNGYFEQLYENKNGLYAYLEEINKDDAYNAKLVKAINESEDLNRTECHAIALAALSYGYYASEETVLPDVIKYYDFENYEKNITPEEQKQMAETLIFSDSYLKTGQKVREYTDQYVDEGIASVNVEYKTIYDQLNISLRYQEVLNIGFVVLLLSVITVLIKTSKKSVKSAEDIDILNEKLNKQKTENSELVKERDKANASKSVFLKGMSGALRSPVTEIMDKTRDAQRNIDDKEAVKDCLGQIDRASELMLEQINSLLSLGRTETGMVSLRKDPLNINNFIDSCESIIQSQINEAGIRFINETGIILHPNVLSDELHLRQIILSIVDNAIKFTPAGGTITVSLNEELDNDSQSGMAVFRFEIEDTGVGMSEKYVEHLFESFSREDEFESSDLGIGMSITKRYVEMMNGTIEVSSKLQQGTKFTVVLPMEIYRSATANEKEEENRLAGSRILIAEDNDLNMEIARKMLVAEGATVIPAENGLIALSLFNSSEEQSIDAILMDIAMPVLDGISVTKEIRAGIRSDAKTVPIIAMVASNTEDDIDRMKEAGMNDYISKPVDVTELVKTLLSTMRTQSNELAQRLEKALKDANTDALTGVKNRNAFELSQRRINAEIESGEEVDFSIVICDVNGLKAINDNVGHDEGNKLLINACRLICRTFKRSPVFRIGGDEFVVILRNDDYEMRQDLVGGLMKRMTAQNYDPMDINKVSFAIGMADFDPEIDKECTDVFKRADVIMYEHKKSIKGEGNVR
ncbi:MAG: diguanylate cyclase [Lachnospiraceae bacterium]|nr:diguanylate cyclase [Lachnospiraceae bacterium]